jgi:DNA-directed RNA polymerase specialized sigma24 family protein
LTTEKEIADFISSGGKITQCPTISNNSDRKRINKKRKKKETDESINDEVCSGCINQKNSCKGLCNPLIWVNGVEGTKEVLLSDLKNQQYLTKDYKEVISELAEDIEFDRIEIEQVFNIENPRQRAIAILLCIGKFNKADIAKFMNLSVSQIYRLSK